MRSFKSLTIVQFKNTIGSISGNSKKSKFAPLLAIFLIICFLPTIYMLYQMFKAGFEMTSIIDQSGLIFSAGFQLTALLIFVFSLFLIPSVYYFSKDINTLLALPLYPQTIIASKFIVCLLYEYMFTAAICIPLLIAYGQVCAISVSMILFMLIAMLTLPIYPLILSSIITMLMMRFAPFMKNRDRFNIIGSILILMVSFGFSFYVGQIESFDQAQLLALLQEGNNSLMSVFSYLFPAIPFIAKAMINTDFISFMIYALINIASIVLFMLIAKGLYFKGVIGVEESSSSRKKISKEALNKSVQRRNILSTYIKKEYKLLFRTPVYLMNCVIMALLPAIMVSVSLFSSDIDIDALKDAIPTEMLDSFIANPNFVYFMIIAGILCGIACANLNLISSTSISREGSNYIFMKYIPIPLQTQINAKAISGTIASIISIVLLVIPIYILVRLPIWAYLLFFVCSSLTSVLGNYLGILIDLIHPKLIWEQEATPVKQNITPMIALFGGVGIAVLIGFGAFYIPESMLSIYAIGLLLISILLCIVCYLYVNKIVIKVFAKL